MTKALKDGWHKFYGYKVWLEGGKVKRAYDPEAGYDMKTLYPYREGKHGGYDLDQDMSLETFMSAWNRGTAYLF